MLSSDGVQRTGRTRNLVETRKEILNAALEDGILETAQRNAETYVRQLILSLGFSEVIFSRSYPAPVSTTTP